MTKVYGLFNKNGELVYDNENVKQLEDVRVEFSKEIPEDSPYSIEEIITGG